MLTIEKYANYTIIKRAISYVLEHRIYDIKEIKKGVFTAKARGTSEYYIHLNTNKLTGSSCDCPFFESNDIFCKHLVALYFIIYPDEMRKYSSVVPTDYQIDYLPNEDKSKKMQSEQYIIDYVNKLNKEELKEELINLYKEKLLNEQKNKSDKKELSDDEKIEDGIRFIFG